MLKPAQIAEVKARGFLINRGTENFSGRVVPKGSVFTAEDLRTLSDLAEKFGSGKVVFTSRLTAEIVGIPFDRIDAACDYAAARGLYFGGTGAKIRPITACKGTTCIYGNYDTQALAQTLHEKYYVGWANVKLPHKFKIGIGGCPNNCIKPALNDFGIMGQRVPAYDPQDCHACKNCGVVEKCPIHAASLDENGVMHMDRDACNNCGKCVDNCHRHIVHEERVGYKIMVGGIWGKRQRLATGIDGIYTKDEVIEMLERSLLLYREQGKTGERFGLYIERIGVDNFVRQLLAGDVMARKAEILSANLHG